MLGAIRVETPSSRLQYALRAWCLFTAAWYLFVVAVVVGTGNADITAVLLGLVAFDLAAPLVFAWGCLAWSPRAGWAARSAGLVLMVLGFVPLAFFAALVLPFVLVSLPAAWRWRGGRAR